MHVDVCFVLDTVWVVILAVRKPHLVHVFQLPSSICVAFSAHFWCVECVLFRDDQSIHASVALTVSHAYTTNTHPYTQDEREAKEGSVGKMTGILSGKLHPTQVCWPIKLKLVY